jgi:hypothetical protein
MKRTLRRLTAAGAAVAALGAAGAVVAASPASASTGIQRCGTNDLKVTLVYDNGGAGNLYYKLNFENTGHYACQLYGYPGVSAVDAHGMRLGPAAGRNPAGPKQYVYIAAGHMAHSTVHYVQALNYDPTACEPKPATDLEVYPPEDRYSEKVPFSMDVCTTSIGVLDVTPVQLGA